MNTMSSESAPRKLQVGGQAVIEGVMMRSPKSLAIAVRRPNGEIVIKENLWRSVWDRLGFLKWPFFRGGVVMVESLVNGMQALTFAANQAMEEEPRGEGEAPADKKPEELSKTALYGALTLAFVLAMALFVALPHLLTWLLGSLLGSNIADVQSLGFHLVDGAIKVSIFVLYIYLISRMKDIQRVFQYHGAEHKSINAYEAGVPLVVDKVRPFPTLHPRCGTSFLIVVILLSILVFGVVFPFMPALTPWTWLNQVLYVLIKIPLMLPVAGLSYEFLKLAGRRGDHILVRMASWPGMLIQRLTTSEPSDDQIEVALVALRKTLWRESQGTAGDLVESVEVFGSFQEFLHAQDPLDQPLSPSLPT